LAKQKMRKLSTTQNKERLEHYQRECQRLFDLQNQLLSSGEILSSDSGDESDSTEWEGMGKKIEKMLNSKTETDFKFEEEEKERLELKRMMMGEVKEKEEDKTKKDVDALGQFLNSSNKVLKISRSYSSGAGKMDRAEHEIVTNPEVIAAYLKIRTRNSDETVRKFAEKLSREEKAQLREKNRKARALALTFDPKVVVEAVKEVQNRRKNNQDADDYFPSKSERKRVEKSTRARKRKCGACGSFDHYRNSKECPLYDPNQVEKRGQKRLKTTTSPSFVPVVEVNDEEKGKQAGDLDSASDSDDDTSSSDTSSSSDSDSDSDASSSNEEGRA